MSHYHSPYRTNFNQTDKAFMGGHGPSELQKRCEALNKALQDPNFWTKAHDKFMAKRA